MECTINWMGADGMSFIAETGSGHMINMDGSPEGGGRNLAPRPMETVLAGTGGCTAYDVVLILKRGRHDVRGCQVKLSADRAESDPKVFTKIHMHFVVTGKGLRLEGGRVFGGRIRAEFSGWLERADNRALVSGVRAAHPRHGGSGAFYVLLRRRSSASSRSLRATPQR